MPEKFTKEESGYASGKRIPQRNILIKNTRISDVGLGGTFRRSKKKRGIKNFSTSFKLKKERDGKGRNVVMEHMSF